MTQPSERESQRGLPVTASAIAPLAGRRLLVCRGGDAGEADAARIRELGGEAVVAALTVTAPPARESPSAGDLPPNGDLRSAVAADVDRAPLERAVDRWNAGGYDWLVVTSAKGAAAFADAGARPAPDRRVAAVGPSTAAALRGRGFSVDLVPASDFSGEGLAAALTSALAGERGGSRGGSGRIGSPPGASPRTAQRILLPLSELADETVETALRDAGHEAERVTAYRTVPGPPTPGLAEDIAGGGFDAILVMSGSAARELAARFAPLPARPLIAAIGHPTARALETVGLSPDVVAGTHTAGGLIDAVAAALGAPEPGAAHRSPVAPDPAHSHPASPEGRTA